MQVSEAEVTLKEKNTDGTDQSVYLTKGKVVMTEDGSMVNVQDSDKSLVVTDGQGHTQMISPKDISSVGTPVNAEEEIKTVRQAIADEKLQHFSDVID